MAIRFQNAYATTVILLAALLLKLAFLSHNPVAFTAARYLGLPLAHCDLRWRQFAILRAFTFKVAPCVIAFPSVSRSHSKTNFAFAEVLLASPSESAEAWSRFSFDLAALALNYRQPTTAASLSCSFL